MNICLFSPEEITKPLYVKDERAEHILKILRKKKGDSFIAGIIGGASGIAKITEINDFIYFDFTPTGNGKLLNPLKMIIGFPRPIQLKRLLRDVSALGVCEIHLTGTELGEKSYMKSSLAEKGAANKMLLDGTVQAGSTNAPVLFLHKNLSECLNFCHKNARNDDFQDLPNVKRYFCGENLNCDAQNGTKIEKKVLKFALDNANPYCSLKKALKEAPEKSACDCECFAAVGSERGWTENERAVLEKFGYVRCGMGERIMRTETAATVCASVILNEMGFLE